VGLTDRIDVENDPVNWVDPLGLYYQYLPYAVDFAEGFLSPTSPPPTPGGLAGFYARSKFDEYVDIDEAKDALCEGASNLWEDYYKIENPGWKHDPYSPYYEPPKRETYWEQGPLK
jgi:hypothetical protein